jgi:hypothetical protein
MATPQSDVSLPKFSSVGINRRAADHAIGGLHVFPAEAYPVHEPTPVTEGEKQRPIGFYADFSKIRLTGQGKGADFRRRLFGQIRDHFPHRSFHTTAAFLVSFYAVGTGLEQKK